MISKASVIVGCAGVATAVYLYRKIVQEDDPETGGPAGDGKKELYQYMMRVPRSCMGMIIGRQGRNASLIHSETGASIRVYQYDDKEIRRLKSREGEVSQWARHEVEEDWFEEKPTNEASEYGFVNILAPTEEKMELAILKIRSIVMDWQSSRAIETIRIPKEAVGFVIGKHGKNIKAISYECRVRTFVIDSDGNNEVMEIRGSEEGITAAVDKIQAAVARYYRIYDENNNLREGGGCGPRGLYENVMDEVRDMEKLKEMLEAEEEFW